jgi:hypothetical protein
LTATAPSFDSQLAGAWREAATRLVLGLRGAGGDELRLAILKRLVRRFGEHGYPGFIKLLLIVAESSDSQAKRQLAQSIALGLKRGELPSGQLTSWGATSLWSSGQPLRAGLLSNSALRAAPRRSLGPIEYLTVWYCQSTQRPYLSEARYREALTRLIELLNHSTEAQQLYPLKLEADIAAGLEGAFTRLTRERLAALAAEWKKNAVPDEIATAALAAGASDASQRQWVVRDL